MYRLILADSVNDLIVHAVCVFISEHPKLRALCYEHLIHEHRKLSLGLLRYKLRKKQVRRYRDRSLIDSEAAVFTSVDKVLLDIP